MRRFFTAVYLALFFVVTGLTVSAQVPPLEWPADNSNQVYFLPQFSLFESISDGEMQFFRKTLARAEKARAKAVILELDTPGGSVETAFKYLSLMEKSAVPIIVYLNPNGISAGMIIALGADRIAISPNGLIGDAMPIQMGINGVRPITEKNPAGEKPAEPESRKEKTSDQGMLDQILEEIKSIRKNTTSPAGDDGELVQQKFLTVFFKMLQVLSEKNSRPVNVIRAMADPYMQLDKDTDGIEHQKRSPLTLSAREAKKLKVVDYVAANRSDLLRQLGLGDAQLVEVKRTPTEQIGAFLALPAIAGLLLVIGLVGIFVEIKTPGFGVPGILGIAALTLFFLGHIASGTSDWGPMVVFFVGLILVALEIFLIPGFGLVGIFGVLCMLVSFFWAFGFENISTALRVVTFSLCAAIIIMILLAVYVLPKTTLFRKVSLELSMDSSAGFKAQTADESLIGRDAVALTALRPAGVVVIDGKRHDAASEGDYLEAGETVTVTACNGFQLVVQRKNM